MAAFAYRAVNAAGKPERGVVEAASAAAARRELRARALLPLAVEAGSAPVGAEAPRRFGWPRRRVGARALATATRQLATLVGADIRIEEALRLAADQAEGPRLRALLLDLRGAILDGQSFAAALGRRPGDFPDYYRASVAAGEASGRLDDVLSHLADFVEARARAQRTIQLALLYPALLALISTLLVVALMVYVVPDIVRVFQSRGADLPFLTRALIGLSSLVRHAGWFILAGIVLAVIAARRWLALPANRLSFDRALAERRPFRRLVRQHAAARFAGTLAQLVQSAVPLVDALAGATGSVSNRHIHAAAEGVTTRVREGGSLHRAMADAGVFPPMLVAIVASGEGGGKLGPALERGANELERELSTLTATVVALVEPAVLLLMGGVVLLMVLAILLPIVGLNDLAGA